MSGSMSTVGAPLAAGCSVGVDVGGTFTDVVLATADGRTIVRKVATTPADPRDGVADGIAGALADAGVDPATVTRVVHGTTLATNVILERRGGPVAFVTTAGFGDMLRLGREVRGAEERFDLRFTVPEPPVERRQTFEVTERCDARGAVLVALDPAEAEAVARAVAATEPAAVAICLLHSYVNPAHEQLVADACRRALPAGVAVVASSEIWPEVREYDRAMTTVMCAYVGPVMSAYLRGLQERLVALGLRCPVQVMESAGGVLSVELAAQRPVSTVESGGAAGVIAAAAVGALVGADAVISFDMGGTTAKAGIVRDGRPGVTYDFHVGGHGSVGGHRPSGFPVKVPVVDLAEVGAGGGSMAWIDGGGALRVGPRSAGADPGPACYSRGGTEPTVTDADLVLGFLHPGALSGGIALDRDLAVAALERVVAGPLGLDVAEAARAVHDIVNATMVAAIRMVTVQRGIDPRDFTLVGFGGAGPMHVARLAEAFGIADVVVPWGAGVGSAVGLVTTDLSVEEVRTHLVPWSELTADALGAVLDDLAGRASKALPAADAERVVVRSADLRSRGQAHQLTVPVPSGPLGRAELDGVLDAFGARYVDAYGIPPRGAAELVGVRVRVVQPVPKPQQVAEALVAGDGEAARTGTRAVHFDAGRGSVDVPVLAWAAMAPGATRPGPVLVEGPDTTVVVPPAWTVTLDGHRTLHLTPRADA
jgi:N-methylhydantoinase A